MTMIQVGHGDKSWSNLGRLRIDLGLGYERKVIANITEHVSKM